MKDLSKVLKQTKGHLSHATKMAKDHIPYDFRPRKTYNVVPIIIASAAAATVALLFAPKSGKELRDDIKNKAVNLKDTGTAKVQEMKDEFNQSYHEADLVSEVANIPPASDDPAAGVGNVHGTPYESTTDETVPADKLDEALADQGVSSEDELLNKEDD